jgi:hypothetical protein
MHHQNVLRSIRRASGRCLGPTYNRLILPGMRFDSATLLSYNLYVSSWNLPNTANIVPTVLEAYLSHRILLIYVGLGHIG